MWYMQMKDGTQRFIDRTLREHNTMVMQMLNKDGSKRMVFNHMNTLMTKEGGEKRHYPGLK